MPDLSAWDWETGEKCVTDINQWRSSYNWVEEPVFSPDGETVAAIVNVDTAEFNVCFNGSLWETEANFEKAWYLRFAPDGRLTVIVSQDMAWTLAVDGVPWENTFDYLWNTQFSGDGETIAAAIQSGGEYALAVNDIAWENRFSNLTGMCLSPDGKRSAAVVQTEDCGETEIYKFQEGIFTVAVDGEAWERNFTNVWGMSFSPDNKHLAAEVRLNLYDYTVAVDGKPWRQTFACVWQPIFHPVRGTVVAPVRNGGKWGLAEEGEIIWEPAYVQCWHQMIHGDSGRMIAIVAPSYGKWTVAVDGAPWAARFGGMVTDTVFSPDGQSVAALGVENDIYRVVVDDVVWPEKFDMAWAPVFSPDGKRIAAKVEKNGRYTIALNGKLWSRPCQAVGQPIFSPDGSRLLIKSIEDGRYYRRVIDVKDIV